MLYASQVPALKCCKNLLFLCLYVFEFLVNITLLRSITHVLFKNAISETDHRHFPLLFWPFILVRNTPPSVRYLAVMYIQLVPLFQLKMIEPYTNKKQDKALIYNKCIFQQMHFAIQHTLQVQKLYMYRLSGAILRD